MIIYLAFLILASIFLLFGIIFWFYQLSYALNPYKIVFLPSNLKKISPVLSQITRTYIPNTNQHTLYEPGCGTGHVIHYLSQSYSWKNSIGIEGDFLTYWSARILQNKKSKVELRRQDIYGFDYSKPAVFYCYLGPQIMNRMYELDLFANSLVISLTFKIKDVEPTAVYEIDGAQKRVLVYDFRSTNP